MPDLWRISNFPDLRGEDGRRASARWHTAGKPIVYLAASPAGALLEVLVHLDFDEDLLPPTYTLLRITVPPRTRIPRMQLPPGESWKSELPLTRAAGDAWLKARRSPLIRVPSAILPNTSNFLLNPLHPEAGNIRIAEALHTPFDPRLLHRL